MEKTYDVTIIGGGVTGSAIAYVLSNYTNVKNIALIEKYSKLAEVLSSKKSNSQTLHFGDIETNYSLEKATKVKKSAELVVNYVKNKPQLHKKFHKMVLGIGDQQISFLEERFEKFKILFPELKKINKEEIAKIEPSITKGRNPKEKIIALLSPDGYAIDFGELAKSFMKNSKNVEIIINNKVENIKKINQQYIITTNKQKIKSRIIIVAASGHSLYFAHKLGYGKDLILLPVAGSFFCSPKLLNGKVYTVQKPKIPFAAVHGDPAVNNPNETRFGPTAKVLPMLERYHLESFLDFFKLFHLNIDAVLSILKITFDPIYFKFIIKNIFYDLPFIGRFFYIKEVKKIVPSIKLKNLHYGKGLGGIRPQIVNIKSKSVSIGEAKIIGDNILFNISPSPGASVCLGNAEKDVKTVIKFLGEEFRFNQKQFDKDLKDNSTNS